MKRWIPFFLVVFSLAHPRLARSVPFNVSDSASLQTALTTASTNNDPAGNTITLSANTVFSTSSNGGNPFTYNSANNTALTILGQGIGSSVIDGGSVSEGMQIISPSSGSFQLSGITFQNGAQKVATAGGLQLLWGGPVTLDSLDFNHNIHTANGGLDVNSLTGTISLTNSLINGNTGSGSQGGFSLSTSGPNGNITLDKDTVSGNNGDGGGGFIVATNTNSPVTITNSTFNGNTSTGNQGGIFVVTGSGGDFTGDNLTFDKNIANGPGAAFIVSGGALNLTNTSVTNNTSSDQGGGIFAVAGTDLNLIQDTFSGNQADNVGGAFLVAGNGLLNLTNNTFLNNMSVTDEGGGAFLIAGTSGAQLINNIIAGNQITTTADPVIGGGFFIEAAAPVDLINNTIFNNSLASTLPGTLGGGIFVAIGDDAATLNLYNNIVWGNLAPAANGQDIFVDVSGAPNAAINLFNNDYTETCFDTGGVPNCDPTTVPNVVLGANLNLDPLFMDVANNNYYLSAASKLIGVGTTTAPNLPATDHDLNPRVFNGLVDIGALESLPSILVTPTDLDFGDVALEENSELIVTVTNQGAADLTVNGMTLSDNTNFSIDPNGGPNPCGSLTPTIAAGQSCTVGIIFAPTQLGDVSATLDINSDDATNPDVVVNMIGTGSSFNISGGGCSVGGSSSASGYLAFLGILMALATARILRRG